MVINFLRVIMTLWLGFLKKESLSFVEIFTDGVLGQLRPVGGGGDADKTSLAIARQPWELGDGTGNHCLYA